MSQSLGNKDSPVVPHLVVACVSLDSTEAHLDQEGEAPYDPLHSHSAHIRVVEPQLLDAELRSQPGQSRLQTLFALRDVEVVGVHRQIPDLLHIDAVLEGALRPLTDVIMFAGLERPQQSQHAVYTVLQLVRSVSKEGCSRSESTLELMAGSAGRLDDSDQQQIGVHKAI